MRAAGSKLLGFSLLLAALAGCSSTPGLVLSVTIPGGDRSLALAASAQLTVVVSTTGSISSAVLWQSSNADAVQVDGAGKLLGLDLGSALISATSVADGSKSGSITVTVVAATPPEPAWTRQFASDGYDEAKAVRFGPGGGVVVAGRTHGGNLEGVEAILNDAFVIQLGANGTTSWIRQFGTAGHDHANGVAVDAEGNVFAGGSTTGDLSSEDLLGSDAFVRKYDTIGDIVWTRQFGTSGDAVTSLATAAEGSVVAVGHTQGNLEGVNAGAEDVFVRHYDALGTYTWTRQFGSSELDWGTAVAVGADGRIAVVGYTAGIVAGGSAGSTDAFVRLYDSGGTALWTRQFGTSGGDFGQAVAIDHDGNVVVAGYTAGGLSGLSAGFDDAYVRKYDAGGQALWTHQFGTAEYDQAFGVATDTAGNVFVTGFTTGDLTAPVEGHSAAFIRKLTPSGIVAWTLQIDSGGEDYANAVDVSAEGDAVIAGMTLGNFEGEGAVSFDPFVRRYGP